MKTQMELIRFYSKNFEKVLASHGHNSHYTTYAYFLLLGVRMGMKQDKIFSWARKKLKEIEEETLSLLCN